MNFSLRTLLAVVCCAAIFLAVHVHLKQQRAVAAAKAWILNEDGAYCLSYPCPNAERVGAEKQFIAGVYGNEYSNPVKEVAFEFYTLGTFEPLTCLRKIEHIAVETVMEGDIDLTPLAKLPELSGISFCKEARNTPGFDTKIAELKALIPNISIEFDTDYNHRRTQTKSQEWVVNGGRQYGG